MEWIVAPLRLLHHGRDPRLAWGRVSCIDFGKTKVKKGGVLRRALSAQISVNAKTRSDRPDLLKAKSSLFSPLRSHKVYRISKHGADTISVRSSWFFMSKHPSVERVVSAR